MKKLLITGAGGFLGCRAAVWFRNRCQVTAFDRSMLDVANADAVRCAVLSAEPDWILHCAAASDTGWVEQHCDEAYRINVDGTINVAKAARDAGAKLVLMSSDQVYNGNLEPGALKETVDTHPKNAYGRMKKLAEERTLAACPEAVALRLAWMYDRLDSPYRMNRNLLFQILRSAREGMPLRQATHDRRGITFVWDVIERLEACFALPDGVYNFGCGNVLNAYETALCAARLMGLTRPKSLIEADETCFLPDGRNLVMDCTKAHGFGIDFPDTIDGIRAAIVAEESAD